MEAAECWPIITDSLDTVRAGRSYDEEQLQEAVILVAAAQLVGNGVDIDIVEELFCGERGYEIRLTSDENDDLGIQIVWNDDEAFDVSSKLIDGV